MTKASDRLAALEARVAALAAAQEEQNTMPEMQSLTPEQKARAVAERIAYHTEPHLLVVAIEQALLAFAREERAAGMRRAAEIVGSHKVGDELAYGSVTEKWIARAIEVEAARLRPPEEPRHG